MQVISDNKGREWKLHLTLRHARHIQAMTGVNILAPEDAEESILQLLASPLKMIDILWAVVEEQVRQAELTRDEFEDGFDGAAYLKAEKALHEEIAFFTQSVDPTRAKLWNALLKKQRKLSEVMVTRLEAYLDSDEVDRMAMDSLEMALKEVTTTKPGTFGSPSGI